MKKKKKKQILRESTPRECAQTNGSYDTGNGADGAH